MLVCQQSQRFIATLSADFDFTLLPFDNQTLQVALESYRMPKDAVHSTFV